MTDLGLWQKKRKLLLIYAITEMGSYVCLLQDARNTGSPTTRNTVSSKEGSLDYLQGDPLNLPEKL